MSRRRRQSPKSAPPAAAVAPVPNPDVDAFFATYRSLPPEVQPVMRQLLVVGAFSMWRTCPIEACRRAGTCRGRHVECFHDRRAELKESIMATFARWIDIAEIAPEEFAAFWEREALKVGIDLDAEEVEEA